MSRVFEPGDVVVWPENNYAWLLVAINTTTKPHPSYFYLTLNPASLNTMKEGKLECYRGSEPWDDACITVCNLFQENIQWSNFCRRK